MKRSHILLIGAVLTAATAAQAQEATRSGYFMDGYSYRHQLNPAFGNDHNYISVPALGNIGLGTESNLGIKKLLYKLPDGQLTTFMSPTVGADEFLSNLVDNNKLSADLNMTLISTGFRGMGGFNTITLSARSEVGLNLPKGLFEFLKLGQQGESSTYSLGGLGVKANAMAEIALGHSHSITNHLDIGAKVKFLVGAGNVNARIDRMNVTLSDSKWIVEGCGSVDISAGEGLRVPTNAESGKEYDRPEAANEIDWDNVKYDKFGIAGMGVAFDLGVVYKDALPGLTLSASLLDLGFVKWNHSVRGITPDVSWSFDGFHDVALDSSLPGYEENKIGQQFDNMWDDLKDCVNFTREATDAVRTSSLAATLHLGAEYTMPFYKGLTAGFLFTHRFNGQFSWNEGRLSANLKPARWFDCTVNVGQSTFGTSMGWMINFHPRGFNFFIGSDHQFFYVTPQMLPTGNLNTDFTVGLNITFG